DAGYRAEMIYTGQTGWMQGARYGFIFDSTLNDFISGELEHAVHQCYTEEKPDVIFIEGQSSLRNPSGPAGAEWIVSAKADAVILQHNPTRKHYKGLEHFEALVAQPRDEIALIAMYGAPTLAVTLNTEGMDAAAAKTTAKVLEEDLRIPVVLPLEDGVQRLVIQIVTLIEKNTNK
ncbi:MAG TPA: NAD-dependent epimerase/dehydratase family protein, partial [Ohtaekwangia sp.]|nr:NAD-dependent epimerase/dehydratase family protein [Ohtaekwangia sp.]